jgi:methylenetetrahydrofolate reductase (NADPH)
VQLTRIDHLKRKLDAGATGAITQPFFENETFYRFRDACAAPSASSPNRYRLPPVAAEI